jgi:hypothetical protein
MPIASDRHLNKIYITWRLNTLHVYKTNDQNINNKLKADYTVTYVTSNFAFPLHFISVADVDFLVNGGCDQPGCPIGVYQLSPLGTVFDLLNSSKICNF